MEIGRLLIITGILLVIVGLIFMVFKGNIPRMPGDIFIKRDGFTFYFPWVTTFLISIILTIIINFFIKK